jgi:hypothetical protein
MLHLNLLTRINLTLLEVVFPNTKGYSLIDKNNHLFSYMVMREICHIVNSQISRVHKKQTTDQLIS